jgi:hypothetical protein
MQWPRRWAGWPSSAPDRDLRLFVLFNAVMGVRPDVVEGMSGPRGRQGHGLLLMALGGAVVFFVIGLIIGKLNTGKR